MRWWRQLVHRPVPTVTGGTHGSTSAYGSVVQVGSAVQIQFLGIVAILMRLAVKASVVFRAGSAVQIQVLLIAAPMVRRPAVMTVVATPQLRSVVMI